MKASRLPIEPEVCGKTEDYTDHRDLLTRTNTLELQCVDHNAQTLLQRATHTTILSVCSAADADASANLA